CQSVVTPKVPFIGKSVSLELTAGTNPDRPVEATNLYLDVAQLDADADFENIDIGVAAGQLKKKDRPNGIGIQPG
ncbi:cholesterol esterase, partial [Streptomyces sp. SID7499]|nr:cholesterol esterase [Streptomyces sp. SID7499]